MFRIKLTNLQRVIQYERYSKANKQQHQQYQQQFNTPKCSRRCLNRLQTLDSTHYQPDYNFHRFAILISRTLNKQEDDKFSGWTCLESECNICKTHKHILLAPNLFKFGILRNLSHTLAYTHTHTYLLFKVFLFLYWLRVHVQLDYNQAPNKRSV